MTRVIYILQDATSAEIRRAYRQLSLQLHPDKSDDPEAAEKFRMVIYNYGMSIKFNLSYDNMYLDGGCVRRPQRWRNEANVSKDI